MAWEIGAAIVPSTDLTVHFAEHLCVIGTTTDELFTSLSGLRQIIEWQVEQSNGINIRFEKSPVFRSYLANDMVAIIVEEIVATVHMQQETTQFSMRGTTVLNFEEGRWKVVHWHVSKPENVQSDTDTFGIEEWKQKTEELEKIVAERTAELTQQKEQLEHTLEDLRNTQNQLIQSEKMASLGELTAGIAHEIQNPLNFVNNFSEVSNELIEEMNVELDKGDMEEAKAIASDIKQNLEKINHHGKRADSIVKGMLQHSRSSSGQKEPTDINALADEYFRLAYHGLRAKDKSFNATLQTNYDSSIGSINIIPQDIGRVILNLITNAFYAVDEKKKVGIQNYEPTVTVGTKKINDKIEITVSDNGNGIPQKIVDKIFQPFFTTKPTGQGTGLGLSMSYEIITKGHGGTIIVSTNQGEGSKFIITLPI